jgi:ABC-type transport system substrate-binding protein
MRRLLAALLVALAAALPAAAQPPKVLRVAFPVAESGFDPAQINDTYSRTVLAHILDGLYHYDPLARPFLIRPNTAEAMPEVSADFRTWTVRIRPGIFFADDPAFGGRPRELVAADYVYSFKRFFDPANKSPLVQSLKDEGLLGVDALREEAIRSGQPFDYDRPVEGLQALDRYTIRFRLAKPRPRFLYTLATGELFGAVAREVIEAYAGRTQEHPVGTGPFRLAQWRRSSLIVLERNPGFRPVVYDAQPAPDDAEGQAVLARLKGRRLPMVDRVEVNIVEASQPRWLAFLQDRFDVVAVPVEYSTLAAPNGRLAPNLGRRGMTLHRVVDTDRVLYYFNWEDPLVGGAAPERVALRRAIRLATDVGTEIRTVRRGQAIPAQSLVGPGTWGYDPALKLENSDHDPARARALLDLYGYVDRDGDGWREQPDGSPLVLRYASQADPLSRQFDELWKKNMDAVGLRLAIDRGQWPEQLKAARAGQLMIWQLGYGAASPDGASALELLYGPSAGGQNLARFRDARLDAIVERMQELPDGPERFALMREGQRIVDALAPHKVTVHRIVNELTQPWLTGYRRPLYANDWWQYVDVDPAKRPAVR